MSELIEGISKSLEYMENHICEDININDIASQANFSSFYYQRIFHVLCGCTVSEYLRNRRLTLAGQDLALGTHKVIDIAMKYGYDSPDSFTRAFVKFHGITPSNAKEPGAMLHATAPLRIKIKLEGDTMLEYKIEKKEQFTVVGRKKQFNMDTSYQEIPKFWTEHSQNDDLNTVCGMFGICIDSNGKLFDYYIADVYLPYKEIPEGYETRVIPAGTWAVFPCKGALPHALQDVNTKIWSEWLPSCKSYELAGNYNIEMYDKPAKNPEDNYSEIWIPIKEK